MNWPTSSAGAISATTSSACAGLIALTIAAQRRALLSLRRAGKIGDDVVHKIEHELDLEEARLKS